MRRGDVEREPIREHNQLLRLLNEEELLDEHVQKHRLRLDSFLRDPGGLELLSALYHFNDVSRRKVRDTAETVRPALTETRRRKLRFRDLMRTTTMR